MNLKPPRVLLLAPLVFALHVAEEAPGFVAWFDAHVDPDLTTRDFLVINAAALFVTLCLTLTNTLRSHRLLLLGLVAWLSFLMLANAVLHLSASLLFRQYVPGTVTAGLLYLPYFGSVFVAVRRHLTLRSTVVATLVGALPMLLQGFSVLALGRRLLW